MSGKNACGKPSFALSNVRYAGQAQGKSSRQDSATTNNRILVNQYETMNNTSTTGRRQYALPIAVMFLLFFSIAFVTNFAGSMGVIVKSQFHATNALSQLGTLANFIAYACLGIPAGMLLSRRDYKCTSLLAVVVGFVGVGIQFLSGYVGSFGVYVAGALVAGCSMCMLNTVVNPMLNTLGGGGNRGNQLIQWGGTFSSIGGTLSPVLLGYLISGSVAEASVADVAPAMMIALGVFALAVVVLMCTPIPEPHLEAAAQTDGARADASPVARRSPFSFRHFTLGAVAIFFYVGVEVGVPNTAQLYMTSAAAEGGLALSPAVAGWVVGLYWFLMMCGRMLGGLLGGRVSSRSMLAFTSALAVVLLLLFMLLPSDAMLQLGVGKLSGTAVPMKVMLVSLVGLCTSVMWGAIFNLSTEGLGRYTALASGIFMSLVCGGGILPFVQNWVTDAAGFLVSYLVPLIGLLYLLFYALRGCRKEDNIAQINNN